MIAKLSVLVATLLCLSACGGGGNNSTPPITLPPSSSGGTPPTASACNAALTSGTPLACTLSATVVANGSWSLTGAPAGMVVQPRSGVVHWTPAPGQLGQFTVTSTLGAAGSANQSQTFMVSVAAGGAAASGLYVAPDGDDNAVGTIDRPLKSLHRAASLATPGMTIFMRGGTYRNDEFGQSWAARTSNSLARITRSGTATQPITIRPHGNEYVRLLSDVNGISFAGAQHWIVQGLELEGMAAEMDYTLAMDNWWVEQGNRTSGRGIANNNAQHITIRDCVIHDFPDAGIVDTDADWIMVQNNIIYNNAWWSTSGTNGVANGKLLTTDMASANEEKIILDGNLVFGNQSLIISHVFSKGFVTLSIDEGLGLHLQNNSLTYFGRARVENNLMLFNGKAGLGFNDFDRARVLNNAFYHNARVVNAGEMTIEGSTLDEAIGNLFHPRPERRTIRDFQNAFTNIGANATTGAPLDAGLFPSVQRVSAVFRNPAALDFRPASGVPAGMGVPESHLLRMFAKVGEYGITVASPTQTVDAPYMQAMKAFIFAHWPASMSHIELRERETGYRYSYSQRCQWPNPPSAAACP